MSNLIPNETKRFVPRDLPWITKPLKAMLIRRNRLYKSYKRHGYKDEDKVRLDTFCIECQQAVENAKLSYLTNLGNKVNDTLLFLFYINDQEKNINYFADDTAYFYSKRSANNLNHDLDVINKLTHQYKWELNLDPLKQATDVLFSCKNNVQNHSQIILNVTVVAKAEEQKHLDLTFESNLSFEKHPSEKIKKAKKILE